MKSLMLVATAGLVLSIGYFAWFSPKSEQSTPAVSAASHAHLPLPSLPVNNPVQVLKHKIQQTQLTQSGLHVDVQSEVQSLSSRDNSDAKTVEIQPGVFLTDVSSIHQSVTVATMSNDGLVQITEY